MLSRLIKNNWFWLIMIFLVSSFLYYQSLFVFYTHDDFFLLKISKVDSISEFLNFFNLVKGPENLGMYRPLGLQAFYLLAWRIFNLNPLGLHVVSFVIFFGVIYLVYYFLKMTTKDEKAGLIGAFLYATSSSHFGQLYALGLFCELFMAFWFLLSVIWFIKYSQSNKYIFLMLSFIAFIFSLLGKETAIVLPLELLFVYLFYKMKERTRCLFDKAICALIPFFITLTIYTYMRFKFYGFPKGDSYVWVISPFKVANSLMWYILWSFNLPDMLVDFIGPGLRINPDLFKFWAKEVVPIFALFLSQVAVIANLIRKTFTVIRKSFSIKLKFLFNQYFFGFVWFILTLLPVLFLPLHKAGYYLTLPLIGVILIITKLFRDSRISNLGLVAFLLIWFIQSYISLDLTKETNWITQGGKTAKNVYDYIQQNKANLEGKNINFYDIDEDKSLPWLPSNVLKTVLSDNNFWNIYWDKNVKVTYGMEINNDCINMNCIRARIFLGY